MVIILLCIGLHRRQSLLFMGFVHTVYLPSIPPTFVQRHNIVTPKSQSSMLYSIMLAIILGQVKCKLLRPRPPQSFRCSHSTVYLPVLQTQLYIFIALVFYYMCISVILFGEGLSHSAVQAICCFTFYSGPIHLATYLSLSCYSISCIFL